MLRFNNGKKGIKFEGINGNSKRTKRNGLSVKYNPLTSTIIFKLASKFVVASFVLSTLFTSMSYSKTSPQNSQSLQYPDVYASQTSDNIKRAKQDARNYDDKGKPVEEAWIYSTWLKNDEKALKLAKKLGNDGDYLHAYIIYANILNMDKKANQLLKKLKDKGITKDKINQKVVESLDGC